MEIKIGSLEIMVDPIFAPIALSSLVIYVNAMGAFIRRKIDKGVRKRDFKNYAGNYRRNQPLYTSIEQMFGPLPSYLTYFKQIGKNIKEVLLFPLSRDNFEMFLEG